MKRLPLTIREGMTDFWLVAPATIAMLLFIFLPVAATRVAIYRWRRHWQMVLHPSLGVVNQALIIVGIEPQSGLSDRSIVLYTLDQPD